MDAGPFFHGAAPSGVVPLDAQSLPRLSSSLPLYGVGASLQGPRTEPPRSESGDARLSQDGALRRLWAGASPVRKATIALLPLALVGFAFVMVAPAPEPPRPAAPRAREPSAAPSLVGSGVAAPAPSAPGSAPPQEAEAVTPRVVGASTGLAKAPDGGVTLERRAADAVHAHRLDEAAALYKELRAAEPRNAAFGAASEVIARGAASAR
jgi:hypothetical protein